jgi:Xaa-Pro aminopeptidase
MYSSNMMVDWQGTLDFSRMREARFARARSELEKRGIAAILTMDGWNTKYVTGTYTPQWTIGYSGVRYALFPREGHPILFEQGDIGHLTRTYSPWLPAARRTRRTSDCSQSRSATSSAGSAWRRSSSASTSATSA